jgi:dienelactone hydrolase
VTVERAGRVVEIERAGEHGEDRAGAYVSVPSTGHGRGVLVLPAPADGEDFAVDVCDRLAREGFVALALTEPGGLAGEDLDAAIAELLNQHETDGPQIATLGFGEGGLHALRAGGRSGRVGAVATFHAAPADDEWETIAPDGLRAPLLAFFGAKEESIANGAADALAARILDAGGRARVIPLATAGAGYMNSARPDGHDANAAAQSWDVLLAFLRAEL